MLFEKSYTLLLIANALSTPLLKELKYVVAEHSFTG